MNRLPRLLLAAAMGLSAPAGAERLPVLQQIDLPHPYYFREMYLPQLTSGPSSLAWSPDSSELIYSMAGSLWRQKIGATQCDASAAAGMDAGAAAGVAQQLTAGVLRLSAGLVAGRTMGDLQLVSQRCHGAVDIGLGQRRRQIAPGERRSQCRTAILARRQAHRFSCRRCTTSASTFSRPISTAAGCRNVRAPYRRAQERAAALLLQSPTITRSIRCGAATVRTSSMCRIATTSTAPAASGAPVADAGGRRRAKTRRGRCRRTRNSL